MRTRPARPLAAALAAAALALAACGAKNLPRPPLRPGAQPDGAPPAAEAPPQGRSCPDCGAPGGAPGENSAPETPSTPAK